MDTNATTAGTAEAGGTLADTVDHAATGAHQAIDRTADAARPAVDRLASGAHQAVDKIAGAATHAAESLEHKGDQWCDAQTQLVGTCREFVRENPVATLGIAVAAGFLLSRLLSSR